LFMVYDALIVGAGVTGVAIARALSLKNPTWQIAVVEKEAAVAYHTSGRNSGVVHPGFNPKPGSLKAQFCVEGNRRLREFCHAAGVPFRDVGMLVVARNSNEIGTLEELYRRGQANGVPDLKMFSKEELKKQEPHIKGCAALYAPTGAVVDSRLYVQALAQEASQHGVSFFFGHHVRYIEKSTIGYTVYSDYRRFRCAYLINAAGLYADYIAHTLGVGLDYTVLPFRGEYYKIAERKAQLVRHLVYPAPNLNFPFLGIHFTPTVDGKLKVGPNAVLALGREAYTNTQINFRETLAMVLDRRTWQLLQNREFRHVAAHSLRTSLSQRAFFEEASTLVEGLEEADLEQGPLPGIRAQLIDRAGRLVDDMIIERSANALHILNVVSPGLTCALPFAEYIADLI
jgi:L-2-hydroxyglutarate oxidase